MTEAIIVALISGVCTLAGVIISNVSTRNKMLIEVKTMQAVMNERIDTLTQEVRKHNGFAERIPRLEERMDALTHEVRT